MDSVVAWGGQWALSGQQAMLGPQIHSVHGYGAALRKGSASLPFCPLVAVPSRTSALLLCRVVFWFCRVKLSGLLVLFSRRAGPGAWYLTTPRVINLTFSMFCSFFITGGGFLRGGAILGQIRFHGCAHHIVLLAS